MQQLLQSTKMYLSHQNIETQITISTLNLNIFSIYQYALSQDKEELTTSFHFCL